MKGIALRAGCLPDLDFKTLISRAAAWGFDGLELDAVGGRTNLTAVPELTDDAERTQAELQQQNIAVQSLSLDVALDSQSPKENARRRERIREYLELAARMGCPSVRISAGRIQALDNCDRALSRILENLIPLVDVAAPLGVTILLENSHEFSGSSALWYLLDGISHPSFAACWNQIRALVLHERPTLSIPRLGSKLGWVRIGDVTLDGRGVPSGYVRLGEGAAEVAKQVDLLRGLLFDGSLVVDIPFESVKEMGGPEEVFPQAVKFLRERISFQHAVLSAYKGDKNAPKLASRGAAARA